MNRIALALLIVAVVVVVNGGCQPALDTNRNNAIATASPASRKRSIQRRSKPRY